jgi:hypothetical protein
VRSQAEPANEMHCRHHAPRDARFTPRAKASNAPSVMSTFREGTHHAPRDARFTPRVKAYNAPDVTISTPREIASVSSASLASSHFAISYRQFAPFCYLTVGSRKGD